MSGNSVVYLKPRVLPEELAPDAPRVVTAFGRALLRTPSKPPGIAACIAYLQEDAERLAGRPMGLRALQNLRTALFAAVGRAPEMALLWREALATACYARVVAVETRFDAPLLTGAGLLHRAGELTALRALAIAEQEVGQRLIGPVLEVISAQDDELVARVTRAWSLSAELRLLILRWREEQNSPRCSDAVRLLVMAQALATSLVHGSTCTPGLVEAAAENLRIPAQALLRTEAATPAILALLDQVAPTPRVAA
jgi:HD-like signal output (HDOD) protein